MDENVERIVCKFKNGTEMVIPVSLPSQEIVKVLGAFEWASLLLESLALGWVLDKFPVFVAGYSKESWMLIDEVGNQYFWEGSWDMVGMLSAGSKTIEEVKSGIRRSKLNQRKKK